MTRHDDFIGQLESYLDEFEGDTPLSDATRDAIRAALPSIHQRPAWWPARRLPTMNNTAKIAMAAAAVLVVALIGIRFLVTDQNVGPPQETLSPTSTPQPFPNGQSDLPPGTYMIAEPFPVQIAFDVPDGWFAWISNADAAGMIVDTGTGQGSGYGVTFWIVDNVYSDPCDPATQLDPPLGPSVDDLVAALSNLPGYRATDPVEVTISGFSGVQFELTAPDYGDECPTHHTWTARASEPRGMLPGETNVLRILDVDGVRLVISSVEYAHTTEIEQAQGIPYEADAHLADQAELRQIIDSIRIESQP